jgi:outer membrane protein assembly factor BamB
MAGTLLASALLVGAVGLLRGDDWPGWRGPDRSGVSPEKGLLKEWPREGPKLLWKASGIGTGYSSPSIVGGMAYVMGAKSNTEYLIALDLKEGKEQWRVEIGPQATGGGPGGFGGGGFGGGRPGGGGMGGFPGPRSTATVDGDLVLVLTSAGDLACVDTKAGDKGPKVAWKKNLTKDFDGRPPMWNYSESPLIDGDTVVCTPGSSKATMVALNKKTGEVIWKSEVPGSREASYASAIVADVGGVKQYVQFLSSGVVGVSAKDGKLLWQYDKFASRNACDTPIFGDGYVFSSTGGMGGGMGGGGFGGGRPGGGGGGFGGGGATGAVLVQVVVDGDKVEAKEVYKNKDLANYHGGVIRVGDCVYGTNSNRLICLDFKTGAKKWDDKCVGPASLVAADGMLYVRGEGGEVALVEATGEGYKEKGRFDPPGGAGRGGSFPHPVIADGKLFLREGDVILCYDIKGK